MLLTGFDKDKDRWLDNLEGIEAGFTRADLSQKIDVALEFLEFVTGGL